MVKSLAPSVRSGFLDFKRGTRGLIAAASFFLMGGVAAGQQAASAPTYLARASAVQRWDLSTIGRFTTSCLSVPGNVRDNEFHFDWDKENVVYFADENLTSADELNGVAQRGMVLVEVPVRMFGHENEDWELARTCFDYERKNGISTLNPQNGMYACRGHARNPALYDFDNTYTGHWPCHSQG
jgi:hypothetical protein